MTPPHPASDSALGSGTYPNTLDAPQGGTPGAVAVEERHQSIRRTAHGACGRSWVQRGNVTGHCAACHETFEGERLFDRHQHLTAQGKVQCSDPGSMVIDGQPLRLVDGTWRRRGMPPEIARLMRSR